MSVTRTMSIYMLLQITIIIVEYFSFRLFETAQCKYEICTVALEKHLIEFGLIHIQYKIAYLLCFEASAEVKGANPCALPCWYGDAKIGRKS